MKVTTKLKTGLAFMASIVAFGTPQDARAEVKLAEVDDWTVTTDGRVNAFVSHVWGETRPDGLANLNWVGFNESNALSTVTKDKKLQKTRIRSGYVPSTLAFNFRKPMSESVNLSSRVEVGIQITNVSQSAIADPTWMEPRAVYLDIAADWGSVRGGRDFGLFGRSNLFMNYELGHAYGLGFPCAYNAMFGGACGHVGFGTIWPDFKAQITYTTPAIADALAISVGVFDPRGLPTYEWEQTPLPRVESEAVFNLSFSDGWSVKAWANAMWQNIATTAEIAQLDMMGMPLLDAQGLPVKVRTDLDQDISAFGGGLQANLGSLKLGGAGYTGTGMDAFTIMTFNPIYVSLSTTPDKIEFRPSTAFLLQGSYQLGDSWLSLGYGKTMLERLDTDGDPAAPDSPPLLRTQTGISAGLYHRIDQVVLGLDYFNAHYGFDARYVTNPAGGAPIGEENSQTVHTVNGGVTLEW